MVVSVTRQWPGDARFAVWVNWRRTDPNEPRYVQVYVWPLRFAAMVA
jgi:hypothetical protein